MTTQTQTKTTVQAQPMPTAPSTLERWFPIVTWLPKYKWGEYLIVDLIAAISVAALLIPESMGYATVAGIPVQYGLYAAPLALIGYAMFGGSKLLVFASAGAVAAISASAVGALSGGDQNAAIVMTAALAFATGLVFFVAGVIKLGWITNFMSKAIMAGFIMGMSIQIIVGQLGKLFGISVTDGNTFEKLWSALSQVGDWNLIAMVIGVGSLMLIFAIQRFVPKLPAALTAVILSSIFVAVTAPNMDLVAVIPTGLPSLTLPTGIDAATWLNLLAAGAVMALVAFSEGWGASANISKKTHDNLDTNQEFRAYGIGNIGSSLLGGMGVAGSLSKSAAAVSAGAKTQMSNIFLAIFVLLTLVFLAPLFQWLPETVLAAIVINAMSESANPRKLEKLWHIDKVDFGLAFITFVIVLAFDLLPAMFIGIALSILYMIYRVSFPGRAVLGRVSESGDFEAMAWEYGRRSGTTHSQAKPVPGVIVYRFDGPIVFANANSFKKTGEKLLIEAGAKGDLPHTVVIDFEEVVTVDTTGSAAIIDYLTYAQRYGVDLALARVHLETRMLLKLTGDLDEIGEDRIYDTVRHAVSASEDKHAAVAQPTAETDQEPATK